MSTKRDYYEILGIQKNASIDDVKKAYRQLAMQFHPDRVAPEKKKEAEERFKEISEAYAVLSDQNKRALYDQYGHAGVDSRYSTEDIFREGNFSDVFRHMRGGSGFESIFEDIFSDLGFDMFGGGRSSRRGERAKHRGEDLELELAISLQEASSGVEKEVSFYHYENCPQCSGSGAQPGSSKETCSTCRGRGVVTSGSGFISFSQTCPACHGEGVRIRNRCNKCGGEGRQRAKKNLKVTVPAGVDTGAVLRLRGEGNWGEGGHGDLYIHLIVRPHDNFEREGDDLKSKVKISLVKAILGADVEVPTLNGKVKMNIPPGTQANTIFRLKGKGIPNIRTHHTGDQLVEIEIEIPKKLSSRERDLMTEFAKLRGETL
jgi:molecular chaperone DnaJ